MDSIFALVPSSKIGNQVGQVVAQDVTGYGDGVFAVFRRPKLNLAASSGGEDADVEAVGIQFSKVGFNLGEQALVVRTVSSSQNTAGVLLRRARLTASCTQSLTGASLVLAHTPDVAGFNVVLHQDITCCINDLNLAVSFDFKSFVMRTVFFGCLRHQADGRNGTHGCRVKRAVFAAEVDGCLINAGVAAVGNDGFGVLRFAVFIPHTAGLRIIAGIEASTIDIARNVQVGNAFVESTMAKSGLAA